MNNSKIVISTITLLIIIAILVGLFVFSRNKSQTKPSILTDSFNQNWHFKCDDYSEKMPVSNGMTYTNTVLGFSMYLPQGWTRANATDTDPHFYNCSIGDGFEIQGAFQEKPQNYFEIITENLQNRNDTKIINENTSLVKNATVTQYTIVDPESGEGWPQWSVIAYPKEKKAFNIGSFYTIEKYPFFSSFKLLR